MDQTDRCIRTGDLFGFNANPIDLPGVEEVEQELPLPEDGFHNPALDRIIGRTEEEVGAAWEGRDPFHLAGRATHGDTVGLLLDTMRDARRALPWRTPGRYLLDTHGEIYFDFEAANGPEVIFSPSHFNGGNK